MESNTKLSSDIDILKVISNHGKQFKKIKWPGN